MGQQLANDRAVHHEELAVGARRFRRHVEKQAQTTRGAGFRHFRYKVPAGRRIEAGELRGFRPIQGESAQVFRGEVHVTHLRRDGQIADRIRVKALRSEPLHQLAMKRADLCHVLFGDPKLGPVGGRQLVEVHLLLKLLGEFEVFGLTALHDAGQSVMDKKA